MDYFDLHCDTATVCCKTNQSYRSNNLAVSFEKASLFDNWQQFFAIWIGDSDASPYDTYIRTLKDYKQKINFKSNNLKPFITLENATLLEGNIDRLYNLYNDGVKAITLTWNGENAIAGGAASNGRLTEYGKDVIKVMNELHIYCDLSHLNEQSFFDVLELAEYPIATHSNCKSICNHRRNLTDEQLKLLKEKGGIVGLCFYPEFLGCEVFEGIYRNLYHIFDLGLENAVACGSDFDGAVMQRELDSIEKVSHLRSFLQQKGLPHDLINNFFYNNAEKIFVSL